jgi:hypothetical protein
MRVVMCLLLLPLGGCFFVHSSTFARQCARVRPGMRFEEALRTVTANVPHCDYHQWVPGVPYPDKCMRVGPHEPWSIQWAVPVMGSVVPDMCNVMLDDAGRVRSVSYSETNEFGD